MKGKKPFMLLIPGRLEIVKELLKRGANVNDKNEKGNLPLFEAVKNGHKEIVIELLKYGANFNIPAADSKAYKEILQIIRQWSIENLVMVKAALDRQLLDGDEPGSYVRDFAKQIQQREEAVEKATGIITKLGPGSIISEYLDEQ